MRLRNKVSIITGGGRGIGLAAAKKFISEGAVVVSGDVCYKNREELILNEFGIYECYLDVTSEESAKRLVNLVCHQFGCVDILVNNAGIVRSVKPFEEIQKADWTNVLDVNTFGLVNGVNAVIDIMKRQKSGKIVNSSSLAGEVGGIRVEASYSVSKSANICLTMALAKYLGPYNINVNAVSPGFIQTDMANQLDNPDIQTVPLRRLGTADDVANAITFLASEEASYLTGVILDVNGGVHMR